MAIFEGGGYGVVNWSGGRRHVTVFSENLSRTVFRGFLLHPLSAAVEPVHDNVVATSAALE